MRTLSRTLRTAPAAAVLAALLASAAPVSATDKGPDAGGYTATDAVVYSFVDIAGTGGASVLAGSDDGAALLTLAFPFSFYGQPYSTVCVSANGAMYFLTEAAVCAALNDFAHVDLTSTPPPIEAAGLYPLWSDLTFQVAGGGSVLYQTMGAVGSRRLIVQWNNAYPQGSASPVTLQVVLSESGNGILFQYKTVALAPGNPAGKGAQATVAIRNAGGHTTGEMIVWSVDAPVLADTSALSFSKVAAAPVITTQATPSSLWPPNNKPVAVTVSGTVALGGPGVGIASATYAVVDEYGQTQPSGAVSIGAGGAFSISLMLPASRRGNDGNGRTYTVTITVTDTAGNTGTGSAVVLVPHDQG
jgi:hypothetical protein